MLFLKAFVVGFGMMLGIEIALGLSHALKVVMRDKKK
jgi:hypothetical protein